ncbi:MAG: acyl-CoA dehydrogenase family protein [Steroidobacteraceae bacterium]
MAQQRSLDFDDLRPSSPFMTPAHAAWRARVRAFVDAQIAPQLAEWDAAGTFPLELYAQAADAGLLGMGFPVELGGDGEADLYRRILLAEEFHRLGSGVVFAEMATHWVALPPLLAHGADELREGVVRPVIAGQRRIAFAITEPGGGSDLAALQTTAERRGDEYLVNGAKTLISGATRADCVLAIARTGAAGGGGLSLLLIETSLPGVVVEPVRGLEWYSRGIGSIRFDGVRVPATRLVGAEDRGFALLAGQLNVERLSGIAAALALARCALAEAIAYARSRRSRAAPDRPPGDSHRGGSTWIRDVHAAYALLDALVHRCGAGAAPAAELAMLKMLAAQTLERCARECLQLLGGAAYTGRSRAERVHREARALAIAGGADEVLRDLVARQYRF